VVDAIQDGEDGALEGELGDLLLNLAFQIVLGEEREAFTAASVTRRMEAKMRRRHPHLYGGEAESWEAIKARERGREGTGVLDGLARGLDPLTKAHRIQEKASGVGFDWDDVGGAWSKLAEEMEEVREALDDGRPEAVEEELGDLLFAVVNVVRRAGSHPTLALDRANRKFHRRFSRLERLAADRGIDLADTSLEALDRIWDEVKAAEADEDVPR
jgi:MazG family protein